jgi:hypothetical protein
VCLAGALATLWPLPRDLADAIPMGTEQEATVPIFNLWQLWWTADRVPHFFAGYMDAPIFHPNKGVTAYTEAMPLLGALSTPLWAMELPPALVYNLVLLLVLVLNGYFAYRLTRAFDAGRGAGCG